MKKKIFTLLLALLLLPVFFTSVNAAQVPDVNREDCSISLLVQYDGEGITDGKLVCYRVGYVGENDGDYFFAHVRTDAPITDVQSRAAAEALYAEVTAGTYAFEAHAADSVDSDGTYHFTGLKTGLYLVVQTEAAEGYSPLDPFLIGVPAPTDDGYVYHVTAKAKTELVPETTPPTKPPETTEPDDDLPQTGQLNWPVPLMASAGLLMLAIGWMLRFGKKEETE